jgi:hypothetical protein
MSKNSLKEVRESPMTRKVGLARKTDRPPKTVTRTEDSPLRFISSDENQVMASFIRDSGGVRLGLERRQFSYDKHIPERRSVNDRRSGLDRRLKPRESE